jgi:hypothetical protein
MMNNSPSRHYSRGERVVLSGLFLVIAGFLTWMAFTLLQTTWQTYALDQRFEREGVQAEGVVSGFRYVTHTGKYGRQNSGDYPVVAIDTPKGVFQILSSYEYPLNKTMQTKLLGQKVDVVYLMTDPAVARVLKWHSTSFSILSFLGVCIVLAALFVYYLSCRMLTSNNLQVLTK